MRPEPSPLHTYKTFTQIAISVVHITQLALKETHKRCYSSHSTTVFLFKILCTRGKILTSSKFGDDHGLKHLIPINKELRALS